jgi:TolB-like protein
MLTPRGQVKLLDFGVAKLSERAQEAGVDLASVSTRTGLIMGTLPYMSPEQICGDQVSGASDIFSLGVVLYQLLTGRHPFVAAEPYAHMQALARALLVHTPTPPHHLNAAVPPPLDRLILRMLEKDPALRPGAAEVRRLMLDPLTTSEAPRNAESHDQAADSVAVLPFTNTGGADAEYLGDGLAESLINNLARIPGLRVVPRSTVFRYKGTDLDPLALGRELQARLLLTGKVLQRGDRLLVQADLVDAIERKQLWGERFNRTAADIFEVEDEIARQIAEKLRLRLSGDQKLQMVERSTKDPAAYDLYLKARHHWSKRTPESIRRSIEYLEAAIARDPNFALAWAGLADTRVLFGWYGAGVIRELFDGAIAAARTAVRLDPERGEARAALGFSLCCTGDWDNGLRECERAVQLSPEYFLAHDWFAIPLSALGRFDEALAAVGTAKILEPLSLVVHHHEAWINVMAGRFGDAARAAGEALELDANYSFGWWWLGIAQTELGQIREAVRSLERAQAIFGDFQLGHSALGHGYGRAGRREEALACLNVLTGSDSRCVDPYHMALVHTGLGQLNEAFARLSEAAAANSAWLRIYGPHDPRLNILRGGSRLDELLGKPAV